VRDKNYQIAEAVFHNDHGFHLSEAELRNTYEEVMEEAGFSRANYVVLTEAPNPEQSLERAELAADYIKDREAKDIPRVLTTPKQKQNLTHCLGNDSEFIYERMDPRTSQDEISEATDNIEEGEKTVFVTHAYHAPRFENYLNEFSKEDHVDTRGSMPDNLKEFFLSQPEGERKFDYMVLGVPSEEPDYRIRSEGKRSMPQEFKEKLKEMRKKVKSSHLYSSCFHS